MNLNASPFDLDQDCLDHQPYPQIFGQNIHHGAASSSSSISCHFFLNNSAQDHNGYYHHQLYQPDHPKEDDAYAYSGGSSTDKAETSGLKLTLWKKEPEDDHDMVDQKNENYPVKWMSSKMRMMHKMKNSPDHDHDHRRPLKINTAKLQESTDDFSSRNSSHSNNNSSPVRVCGDCNTTKTPLWRSGPKGPKSLCNACGIRQRKARRALAAAAANGTPVASDQTTTSALKIKLQNKDKNIICKTTHGSTVPLKKRYKMAAAAAATSSTSAGSPRTKIEEFLMNFSKKLSFHHVFPEDEKDAAILLMALSSGLIHG